MAGGPMSLAIWPRIIRLLGRWPMGQKFQNDHWFADDNFKFDENGGKFSEKVENTMWGKGEIARYEQFLLFPTQCFLKTFTADM